MNEKQTNALKVYLTEECSNEDVLSLIRDINSYDGSLESLSWEDIDSFDELCEGMKPWEIARAIHFGDFNPMHSYWRYDSYGNFESVNFVQFDETEIEEIVEAVDKILYRYLPDEIKNILDENEEESEDEDE